MAKRPYKLDAQKRDPGRFLVIPYTVLESQAYLKLSPAAVKLLLDIAGQFCGGNNGKLYCAWKLMKNRGWHSETTLGKAKQELLNAQFIAETRKGARPNRAAWYGVTWRDLDPIDGMDIKPAAFPRGGFWKLSAKSLTPVSGVRNAA